MGNDNTAAAHRGANESNDNESWCIDAATGALIPYEPEPDEVGGARLSTRRAGCRARQPARLEGQRKVRSGGDAVSAAAKWGEWTLATARAEARAFKRDTERVAREDAKSLARFDQA